jgi:hypothetical protein
MYLQLDLAILTFAIVWFLIGMRVLSRVPLVHDPMVTFRRYHPRLIPVMAFILILLWPVSKLIWRMVEHFLNNNLNKNK